MNQIVKELNQNDNLFKLMKTAITCSDAQIRQAVNFLIKRKESVEQEV